MGRHELFGSVTYTHVALSGTKRVRLGLSRSQDRRSIVAVGQRGWRVDGKLQVGPGWAASLEIAGISFFRIDFPGFFSIATVRAKFQQTIPKKVWKLWC